MRVLVDADADADANLAVADADSDVSVDDPFLHADAHPEYHPAGSRAHPGADHTAGHGLRR